MVSLLTLFFRASPNLHFVRGRVIPSPWWQKRREPIAKLAMDEITNDNKEFLREVAQDQYSVALKSPLKEQPWPRNQYNPGKTMRTGLIGLKIGVVPHWTTDGSKVFVTILQVREPVSLCVRLHANSLFITLNKSIRNISNEKKHDKWLCVFRLFALQNTLQ